MQLFCDCFVFIQGTKWNKKEYNNFIFENYVLKQKMEQNARIRNKLHFLCNNFYTKHERFKIKIAKLNVFS